MDFEELFTVEAHEKGAEMQVKDENGNPLDMYITFMGVDSKAFRRAVALSRQKIVTSDDDSDLLEPFGYTLAEVATGWRGFKSKGKEIKFSKETLLQLFKNAPYIVRQTNDFVGSRINFTKG